MTKSTLSEITVIGIDIGKNTFHAIGLNQCGRNGHGGRWQAVSLTFHPV